MKYDFEMEGHWHAWTELKHFFYLLVAILFWSPKKMAGIVGLPRMFWYCHWQNEEHNNKVALWWNEKHDNKANEDCTTTKLWYNEMTYGKTKTGQQNKLMTDEMIKISVQTGLHSFYSSCSITKLCNNILTSWVCSGQY